MSESQTETSEGQSLLAKLFRIAETITHIEKRGENTHHGYKFVQAADVTREVRDLLLKERIFVVPAAGNARHLAYGSKGGHLTTVDLCYRFLDLDSRDKIEIPWVGVGADTGGDKGIYKAYTGGLKYALLNLFLIPMTDDPERDGFTEHPSQDSGQRDDQRPVAPRIPVDRAQSILDSAVGVGMASRNDAGVDLQPVFQAVLAQHGVEKIGLLNVDQAESVEAFLAAEASNASA